MKTMIFFFAISLSAVACFAQANQTTHTYCTPSRSTLDENLMAGSGVQQVTSDSNHVSVSGCVSVSIVQTESSESTALNITSCRGNATKYYVDGIPMREPINLPVIAIEQISVITNGVPSRYEYSDENSLASCYSYSELLSSRFKLK